MRICRNWKITSVKNGVKRKNKTSLICVRVGCADGSKDEKSVFGYSRNQSCDDACHFVAYPVLRAASPDLWRKKAESIVDIAGSQAGDSL